MTDTGHPKPPGPTTAAHGPGIARGEPIDASGYLLRALSAKTAEQRRRFAEEGLCLVDEARHSGARSSGPGSDKGGEDSDEEDDELRALLLRQLYLSEIEDGEDDRALSLAAEMIDLGTLGDIARQDAARAALGVKDTSAAISHLRIAARVCPPARRAFHYGHLGALLRFEGQLEQSLDAFEKALRWATEDRPLYLAARGLTLHQQGTESIDLAELRSALEAEEPRKGYALWILGELCLELGEIDAGKQYLNQFLLRQTEAPRAKTLALSREIAHVHALLRRASA